MKKRRIRTQAAITRQISMAVLMMPVTIRALKQKEAVRIRRTRSGRPCFGLCKYTFTERVRRQKKKAREAARALRTCRADSSGKRAGR